MISAALKLAAPHFPHQHDAAVLLRQLGAEYRIDPLTEVALVDLESDWYPRAVSPADAYGLGQVRLTNFVPCQEDLAGAGCDAVRERLFDWRENLRLTARFMASWRSYCSRTVGSALAVHWLQGYNGRRGFTCGHVHKRGRWVAVEVSSYARGVMARRRQIIREVSR